jgi:hypothetical protein
MRLRVNTATVSRTWADITRTVAPTPKAMIAGW